MIKPSELYKNSWKLECWRRKGFLPRRASVSVTKRNGLSGCNYTEVSGQTYLLHSCQRVSPEHWIDQLFPTALLLEIRSFNTRSANSVVFARMTVCVWPYLTWMTVARTLKGGGGLSWSVLVGGGGRTVLNLWRTHQQIRRCSLPKKNFWKVDPEHTVGIGPTIFRSLKQSNKQTKYVS